MVFATIRQTPENVNASLRELMQMNENELLLIKQGQIESLIKEIHIMMRNSKKGGRIQTYQDILNNLENCCIFFEKLRELDNG